MPLTLYFIPDHRPESFNLSNHQAVPLTSLRYRLGELSCVVRFEVDACYEETSTDGSGSDSLTSMMDRLAINAPIDASIQTRPPMPQTMAAELKTASKFNNIGAYIPQLWFGKYGHLFW